MRPSLNPTQPTWILIAGDASAALGDRPISIGRLPECDLSLSGGDVSRLHAFLVPTPTGPMLVDRSQYGTRIDGERLSAPVLLSAGDTFQIGEHILELRLGPPMGPRGADGSRIRHWVARYGPSELLGTLVTIGAATTVEAATGSTVVAAFAGTLAEVLVYYGIMILRETIREAYEAGRRGVSYGYAQVVGVIRNVVLEFGLAEALDSGLIRPFFLSLGLQIIGGQVGALVGKLAADLVFYGPVLATYEWRLARTQSVGSDQASERRRRTTSSVAIEQ